MARAPATAAGGAPAAAPAAAAAAAAAAPPAAPAAAAPPAATSAVVAAAQAFLSGMQSIRPTRRAQPLAAVPSAEPGKRPRGRPRKDAAAASAATATAATAAAAAAAPAPAAAPSVTRRGRPPKNADGVATASSARNASTEQTAAAAAAAAAARAPSQQQQQRVVLADSLMSELQSLHHDFNLEAVNMHQYVQQLQQQQQQQRGGVRVAHAAASQQPEHVLPAAAEPQMPAVSLLGNEESALRRRMSALQMQWERLQHDVVQLISRKRVLDPTVSYVMNAEGYAPTRRAVAPQAAVPAAPQPRRGNLRTDRRVFNDEDDRRILEYAMQVNARPFGNGVWLRAEQQGITSHSWQSMRNRFRRYIVPRLTGQQLRALQDHLASVGSQATVADALLGGSYGPGGHAAMDHVVDAAVSAVAAEAVAGGPHAGTGHPMDSGVLPSLSLPEALPVVQVDMRQLVEVTERLHYPLPHHPLILRMCEILMSATHADLDVVVRALFYTSARGDRAIKCMRGDNSDGPFWTDAEDRYVLSTNVQVLPGRPEGEVLARRRFLRDCGAFPMQVQ